MIKPICDGSNVSNPSLIDIRLKNISNIEEIQHGKTTTWVVHHDEDFDLYIHSDTLLYEQAYWKNGKLKYQGSFKHGKLHGVGRSYSKDGNLTFMVNGFTELKTDGEKSINT